MRFSPALSRSLRRATVPKSAPAVPRVSQLAFLPRGFATSRRLDDTWGFVGLGQMGMFILSSFLNDLLGLTVVQPGYHMAKNLRAKIPAADTLVIRDVNEETAARFVEEARKEAQSNGAGEDTAKVLIAQDAREVAEQSVSRAHVGFYPWTLR